MIKFMSFNVLEFKWVNIKKKMSLIDLVIATIPVHA